jgi:hypothetical protein
MSYVSKQQWESLERRSATAFTVGAALFAVAAAFAALDVVAGTERLSLLVGEAFIAGGWLVALVGLLGLYPEVDERNHRLALAGAVFAGIGILTFAVLGVASLYGYATGAQPGNFPIPIAFILPGVFVGSLLAFVTFSVAVLRSEDHSRTLGLLMLGPTLIFLMNLLVLPAILGPGPNPPEVGFVVTGLLALAMLSIGYVLRSELEPNYRAEGVPAGGQ